MKKENISFNNMNLVIILSMSILVYSCIGQENKNDVRSRLFSKQTGTQNSILENDQAKEQISQVVRMMFQDSKGNIWFGTQNGAFRLTGDSLTHVEGIRSETGKGVTIKDITEDKDGTIWFGHSDGISNIKVETVRNYYESDGLLSDDVWCIESDANGKIWIGTIEGACIFNGQAFTKFNLPEGMIDSSVGISSTKMVHNITEDSKGSIWLCTNAGLFSYTDNNFIHVSEKFGIQTNFVNEIFEDKSGETWVSTKQGLYKLTENKAINITEGKIETGKGIGSIAEDRSGKIWFVSNQHNLYTYDGNELVEFQKSIDNKGPVVFQIYKDQSHRLWFVGFGGAYRLVNGEFLNITKDGPW